MVLPKLAEAVLRTRTGDGVIPELVKEAHECTFVKAAYASRFRSVRTEISLTICLQRGRESYKPTLVLMAGKGLNVEQFF